MGIGFPVRKVCGFGCTGIGCGWWQVPSIGSIIFLRGGALFELTKQTYGSWKVDDVEGAPLLRVRMGDDAPRCVCYTAPPDATLRHLITLDL